MINNNYTITLKKSYNRQKTTKTTTYPLLINISHSSSLSSFKLENV